MQCTEVCELLWQYAVVSRELTVTVFIGWVMSVF